MRSERVPSKLSVEFGPFKIKFGCCKVRTFCSAFNANFRTYELCNLNIGTAQDSDVESIAVESFLSIIMLYITITSVHMLCVSLPQVSSS